MPNALAENLAMNEGSNLRLATGYIVGAVSGLVTGVAADGALFALRNVNTKSVAISCVRLAWATTTAFAAAQALAFRVHKVYSFTANYDTGGTVVQAHYLRQSQIRGSSVGDRVATTDLHCYIAATGAITGTSPHTAEDDDEPDFMAVGAGATLPGVFGEWVPANGLPLVLEQNQGIVVKNHIAMGASGVGNLWVGVEPFRENPQ